MPWLEPLINAIMEHGGDSGTKMLYPVYRGVPPPGFHKAGTHFGRIETSFCTKASCSGEGDGETESTTLSGDAVAKEEEGTAKRDARTCRLGISDV